MNDKGLAYCESAVPWQLGFQDPATPIMEGIVTLHHEVMALIVFIGVFVAYLMVRCVQLFSRDVHPKADRVVHGTALEIIWTITPALILLVIAVPSFMWESVLTLYSSRGAFVIKKINQLHTISSTS